ncbi:Variant-silencing SET protein [Phytophthora megakarya]|uniref:Variant-silencing SET protein n=1 Tax=Phytophthora megakarya TaxID=4795 RepID=A0A225UN80_9STRA|nr:Variant-silencing SET protein [Phytophthora megakarya]
MCGFRCRNFRRFVECDVDTCDVGRYCSNRPWAVFDKAAPALETRATERVGQGVFALEDIEAGVIVCEYIGEIIGEAERQHRRKLGGRQFLMAYGEGRFRFIDAGYLGNISRFCNHSCQPNSRAEQWTVKGVYRIAIVALLHIKTGEEITFDYGPDYLFERCRCSSCFAASC